MTVEELEILINANIEPALKEIKKLMPQITSNVEKAVKTVSNSMGKIDMNKASNKIQTTMEKMKQKVNSFFKSNNKAEVEIKVNDKEALKQIKTVEKQIEALQKKIEARKSRIIAIDERSSQIAEQIANEYTPNGMKNDPKMAPFIDKKISEDKEYKALTKEDEKLTNQIKLYEIELVKANETLQELKKNTGDVNSNQKKVTDSAKKLKVDFNQLPKISQRLNSSLKGVSARLKVGLGQLFKYTGALFSLRSIYNILRSSAQSWLSSQNEGAQQLSANIEYMKYALGSVFAPIIQYVTNLVYQLLKAIQSLVYAFSGVNIFAKATANSMKSAAGSASKASQSLSGVHSDINNVSDNNSGGGGGDVSPNMDLSDMDSTMNDWINKVKEKLQKLFQPISNSWNTYGQPLIDSINNSFLGIKNLITSIGSSFEEVWLNGTGEETINLILQLLTSVFNIIGNITSGFSEAWNNAGSGTQIIQSLWNGFNNLLSILKGAYQTFEKWTKSDSFQTFANAIIGICQTLSSWFEKITVKLKEIWENGGEETFTKLLEFISKVAEAIDVLLQTLTPVVDFILAIVTPVIEGIIKWIGYVIDALSGVLDFIIGIFTGDWEKAWSGIKKFFESVWNAVKTVVETVINFIKTYIDNGINMIKTIWSNIWNAIKTAAVAVWNGIKETISNVINGIKNGISNALNIISTIWNNIWGGIGNVVSNVWNGIWGVIKGIINMILGGIENFVNGTIRGINVLLSGISSIANAVGSLIGLDPIYLRLSTISLPRLAKGGVIDNPTIAMMGEYSGASNNPEIVTPQNIMAETFREEMSDFFENNAGGNKPIRVQLYLGSNMFIDEVIDGINEKTRQTGKAQIKVAYE